MHFKGSSKRWRRGRLIKRSLSSVGSGLGILLEEHVMKILITMRDKGEISNFTRHPRNSAADWAGKDFTVFKFVNGVLVKKSFGVTISAKRCWQSRQKHPRVPTFWFLRGLNTDLAIIRNTILTIFSA